MAEYRDIVVIGAGIAGMTAAIYAARAGKSVQVLECEGFGGQIASSPQVENYPGIASVSGAALSDAMYSQASALGVQFSFARAAGVQPQPDGGFVVPSDGRGFACRRVVLAGGGGCWVGAGSGGRSGTGWLREPHTGQGSPSRRVPASTPAWASR